MLTLRERSEKSRTRRQRPLYQKHLHAPTEAPKASNGGHPPLLPSPASQLRLQTQALPGQQAGRKAAMPAATTPPPPQSQT